MADWPLTTSTYIDTTGTNLAQGGVSITPSATAHTKGSWVELTAATLFEYSRVTVQINRTVSAANYHVDIGIGGAGAETVLIADLGFGGTATTTGWHATWWDFPIHVPKGSRLSSRCQSNIASGTATIVSIIGIGESFRTASGFSQVLCLGAVSATTRGVPINCGAAANTYGAWAEVSAATPNNISAVSINLPYDLNTAKTSGGYGLEIGTGTAGNEVAIFSGWTFYGNVTTDVFLPVSSPTFPMFIPQGSRVSVRGRSSVTDATDRIFDVMLHGVI
jgi:hypothetical protein